MFGVLYVESLEIHTSQSRMFKQFLSRLLKQFYGFADSYDLECLSGVHYDLAYSITGESLYCTCVIATSRSFHKMFQRCQERLVLQCVQCKVVEEPCLACSC